MSELDRRTFLRGGLSAAGVGLLGGPRAAQARPASAPQTDTAPAGRTPRGEPSEGPGATRKGEAVEFHRRVPVRHSVDVFVAGGGPSGVAAAVTAARQGRSVFLAEGHTCFGGMGAAALVPAFMSFGDGVSFLAGGIGRDVLDRFLSACGQKPTGREGLSGAVVIRAEVLKTVYDELVVESGAGFSFQTQVIAVEAGSGRMEHAVCAGKSGLFAVRAKMFVDCTGDGDLAAWAGAPFEKGDDRGRMMAGTLCSLWAQVDWEAVRKSGLNAEAELAKAFKDRVFTHEDPHLPGMFRVGASVAGGNLGHTFGVDSTDERSLTAALLWGRKSLKEYETFYKKYMKGFEEMVLVATGSLLGVRESRRILGDYVLCLEDFHKRAVFPDEIGRFAYPVDIHAASPDRKDYDQYARDFRALRYGKGESYGIPYRSLTPRRLENVLVAGRCLSADRYIQSSVRVMPGCFITGQAAGMAAAIAAERGVGARGVDVGDLQRRLKKIGAFLPNFKG